MKTPPIVPISAAIIIICGFIFVLNSSSEESILLTTDVREMVSFRIASDGANYPKNSTASFDVSLPLDGGKACSILENAFNVTDCSKIKQKMDGMWSVSWVKVSGKQFTGGEYFVDEKEMVVSQAVINGTLLS